MPRLTQPQLDAIKLFNQLAAADDLRLDAVLEPGDIQLLNNHTVLHARTAFVDHQVWTCLQTVRWPFLSRLLNTPAVGGCLHTVLLCNASHPLPGP